MSDPAMGLLNSLLDGQFEAAIGRAGLDLLGRPAAHLSLPSRPVELALTSLGPISAGPQSPAYIRAVIGLVDELVDQIERPDLLRRSRVDEDLKCCVIAAAELRKTLEETRPAWEPKPPYPASERIA